MKTLDESIIASLDGSHLALLEHIPYLLQDLWAIGADPDTMANLILQHIPMEKPRILDLGCGKGAVSVRIAQEVDCTITGIDGFPGFIQAAEGYAQQYHLQHCCTFEVGDIRLKIKDLQGFDIIILGAIGPVFGDLETTLHTLKKVLNTPGYVLLDDGYLEDDDPIEYQRCLRKTAFYHQIQAAGYSIWHEELFHRAYIEQSDDHIFDAIKQRAGELIVLHPEKRSMFEAYIEDQIFENSMLEKHIITGTWLLSNIPAPTNP